MSPVHRLSTMGSFGTNKIDYPSMLASYGDYGALQRITSQILASDSSGSVALTNIPATYQDLMLVIYGRDTSANTSITGGIYLNTISTSNWSSTQMRGDGSSATSGRTTTSSPTYGGGFVVPAASATANIFGSVVIHILNYASTTVNKTVLARSAADLNGSGLVELRASLWASTAAVNRIDIASSANWRAGTYFGLYGVKASAA